MVLTENWTASPSAPKFVTSRFVCARQDVAIPRIKKPKNAKRDAEALKTLRIFGRNITSFSAWIGNNFRVHDFSDDGETAIGPRSKGLAKSSAINVQGEGSQVLSFIPPVAAIAAPRPISEMLIKL